jgi:hypothetical protein
MRFVLRWSDGSTDISHIMQLYLWLVCCLVFNGTCDVWGGGVTARLQLPSHQIEILKENNCSDMYIYYIRIIVDSYMFRPPILAIFMEVFLEGIVHRTLQQFTIIKCYASYDIINLHISICTCWLIFVRNYQWMVMTHLKFIKHKFCSRDGIKRFTCFIIPPKSATEIGWWPVR